MRLVLPLAILFVLGGCRDARSRAAQDSTFVQTMVELRRLPRGARNDSAARAAVLERRGLTTAALERAGEAIAADPPRAARVWTEIERRATAEPSGAAAVPVPVTPPARP
jgi:hypothetical protein